MAATVEHPLVGMSSVYVGYRPRSKPKKHRASSSFSSSGGCRSGEMIEKLVSRRSDRNTANCNASPVQERRAGGEAKTAAGEQRIPAPTNRLAQQGSRRRQRPVFNSPPRFAAQNRRQRARQPPRIYTPAKADKVDARPPDRPKDLDSPKIITVSTSADSGRGEELSSSCESSIEPQVPGSAVLIDTLPKSRHSSCSDLDDDVFLDALRYLHQHLSKLPSEDDDYSSIGSSAFVTPLSTRSQSPTHLHAAPQCSGYTFSPIQLRDSLQRVCDQQQESCDCHVTSTITRQPDHVALESHPQLEEAPLSCPKSPKHSGLYVGDIELAMEDNQSCGEVGFELQSSVSSSQSPVKPTLNQPDILCVPSSRLAHPHPHPHHQHSFSSISTTSPSPQSSTCSHSSHPPSPLTLSPSPTPPCEEEDGAQQEAAVDVGHRDITCEHPESQPEATPNPIDNGDCSHEREDGCLQSKETPQDEWPDICIESSSVRASLVTQQFTPITTAPEVRPPGEGAPDFVPWPSSFPHLSHPQTGPPFPCPPPVLPPTTDSMVYCLQSAAYCWPGYPSAFLPRPHPPHPPQPQNCAPVPAPSLPQCFHPLHETWVMWYDKITGSTRNQFSDYQASLNHLYRVGYVEDFWRLYNNIMLPSELDRNANYHFFKHNIKPLWEDPANKNGGKWVLTVREDASILDKAWMELLLALIGEQMSRGHLVNGAVMSRRKKGDRIALWTCKKSKKANLEICKEFIRVLALACEISELELPKFVQQLSEDRGGLTLVYMHHADSLRSGTSYQNDTRISLRDHIETILDGL